MKTTRNKTISLCVAAVVLVAGTLWAGNGVWTELSGMQTGRDQFTGCVIGDEIFVFGGNDPTGYNLYTGEKYNTATDTWSSIADNSQGVEELTGVELDGKFYVFGGWGGFDDPINGYYGVFNFNEMYDPATNTWTTLARKPTTTAASVAAVYEDEIYLFGGYYSDERQGGYEIDYAVVEAYNPNTNTWRYVTEMPEMLFGMAIAVQDNFAYLIGGVNMEDFVFNNEVMAYDFETGVWIRDYCRVPSDVVRVYSYAGPAPVRDGKVYLAGDIEGTLKKHKASNKFAIFDVASKQWASGPVLPEPRQSSLTVLANNTIYVIGGSVKGSDDARNTVFAYEIDDSMTLEITKFAAKAGKTQGTDSVQFAGVMQIGAHLMAAGEIVVRLDAADMASPLEWTFPINDSTFKKGRFNGKSANSSFRYSVKTGKMVFSAKNEDLTGLACPLTVTITIGDVSESIELDEDIVNGPKKPCPPQFLMGVRNSMTVDRAQVKFGKKPDTDSLTVRGFFTIADDYDKSNPMLASLGGQTFTVSGDQFKPGKFSESCNKAVSDEGPLVKAKFDFAKCTFQIQVRNAFFEKSGEVEFGLNCFGNDLPAQSITVGALPAGRPPGLIWVTINDPGFVGQMSRYETTNAQFAQYLNAALASNDIRVEGNYVRGNSGPYLDQNYYWMDGSGTTYDGATNGGASRINFSGGTFTVDSGFGNHPVTYVSWYGAAAFASYYGWRLPTEWEWQAVASFNGAYTYGCGNTINNNIANYWGSHHPHGTTPVGQYGVFGYGMADMAGNVWEWTSTVSDSIRVIRGGGWDYYDYYCTVSYRYHNHPFRMYDYYGFRVCR